MRVSITMGLFCITLALTHLPFASGEVGAHSHIQTSKQPDANSIAQELQQAAKLLQAGKRDEAEPLLRRFVLKYPNNYDAHNLLGILLDQRGQSAEAESEYRTALRLNPNGTSAKANLGVLLARTNRGDESIKILDSVLEASPDHPQATLNLGLQYSSRGDDARAIPLLQKAITLGLDSYDVRYRLGVSLYNLSRLSEAENSFKAALSLSPKAAEPYFYLGLIEWANG